MIWKLVRDAERFDKDIEMKNIFRKHLFRKADFELLLLSNSFLNQNFNLRKKPVYIFLDLFFQMDAQF